ncbi:hypothetical protein [Actinomadura chibensis]|uniref:Uncharacterized protein n=1 Tax=Actinomadura chibensis TaxID=392828 RepID=A0A5D0NLP0_9ACTN|nr:hypothetical protein [Actinomadura chibensis]TYB45305.1 hypothetical protein FXF69_17785 [Actinomadura chibensis]
MRRLWALMRRSAGTAADWDGLTRHDQARAVRGLLAGPCPETVFLFAGLGAEARRAFEVFPDEARAWRSMAEMEAARARAWSRQGRVWDAGLCVGRAQAYRAAARQVEDVLIESLGLWDQYERQAGENGR